MRRRNQFVVALSLTLTGAIGAQATAQPNFAELIKLLPSSPNTLVMLNADQIFNSQVAVQSGWKHKYDAAYASAPLMLPPSAQQFVLAADLDLSTFKPRWEAAVMRLADDPTMTTVSRTVRGGLDNVGGVEAVATPRGALVVKFAPRLFGGMRPASRQAVARWIRDASATRASLLSPYLQSAADVPDRVGTEIIMAVDFTDALARERVRQAIDQSAVLRGANINLDQAADVLASLQGVTLGARVTQRVYGKLKVDFASDVSVISAVAKPLLLEILDEAGAAISEFDSWNAQVQPRQISIEGELTASGLRRLFSFLELDTAGVAAAPTGPAAAPGTATPDAASQPSGSQADTAQLSLSYFQAIQHHLDDLRNESGAKSYASIALWFDKYARRIERLPILGVDTDLVNYGQYVVNNLRNAVDAIRGVGIRSGAQSAQVTSAYSGYNDYYLFDAAVAYSASPMNRASAEVSAVEAQRRAIRAQEKAQGTTDARTMMRQIQDKTSEIRLEMTGRYMIEFTDRPAR